MSDKPKPRTTDDLTKLLKQGQAPKPTTPPDWMIPKDAQPVKPPKKK